MQEKFDLDVMELEVPPPLWLPPRKSPAPFPLHVRIQARSPGLEDPFPIRASCTVPWRPPNALAPCTDHSFSVDSGEWVT